MSQKEKMGVPSPRLGRLPPCCLITRKIPRRGGYWEYNSLILSYKLAALKRVSKSQWPFKKLILESVNQRNAILYLRSTVLRALYSLQGLQTNITSIRFCWEFVISEMYRLGHAENQFRSCLVSDNICPLIVDDLIKIMVAYIEHNAV